MIDPLAEVVGLLQPSARFNKMVSGAGRWGVARPHGGQPFYCAILEGSCRLAAEGFDPIVLEAGDFALVPSTYGSSMQSIDPPSPGHFGVMPIELGGGEFRIGDQPGAADLRMMVGHCEFASPDAALLVSLLPRLVHVRGEPRLAILVRMVGEESRAQRPARDVVLARLLEVLLIEAFRSTTDTGTSPGLLRGLADSRLAAAIRGMHEDPKRSWTVPQLAREAALSRSTFFERFNRAVGVTPMEYLLAWRMALAKDMLRRKEGGLAEVADRVGYSSASTFSVAFTRHVGLPPTRYARERPWRLIV